jgi:hypothetical protein
MGIVLENNQTVSAGAEQVNIKSWGFEDAQKGRLVFRRSVP